MTVSKQAGSKKPQKPSGKEVDDRYISSIEIEDIKASKEERARGESKRFSNLEETLEWLDAD